MECLPIIFSRISVDVLYKKTKSPRFLPCSNANFKMLINYFLWIVLNKKEITKEWTNLTLLPY